MNKKIFTGIFLISSLISSAHAEGISSWGQPTAQSRAQERARQLEQRRVAMEQLRATQRAQYEQQKLERQQARLAHLQAKQQGHVAQGFGQSSYGTSGIQPGSSCNAGETNPIKCKVCAIYGEDHGSREGMYAVAGVIQTRAQSGHWGSDACRIVYAPGQFVGAHRRLPNDPALIASMASAAQNASANGYMGFRSYCMPGRNTRIGPHGNCYGTADASKYIELDPTMTAEDVDAEAAANLQFAEADEDSDAG